MVSARRRLGRYRLTGEGSCATCAAQLPGVFDGPRGSWGPRRQPVFLGLPDAATR